MIAKLKSIRPNRVAVYLTSFAGLIGALAPVIANLDLTSTLGVIAGLGAIVVVVRQFLVGWQQQERDANAASLQLQVLEAQEKVGISGRSSSQSSGRLKLPR